MIETRNIFCKNYIFVRRDIAANCRYPFWMMNVLRSKGENMKKMLVVFIVLVVAFSAVIPAGAWGGSNGNGTGGGSGQVQNGYFIMTGTVAAIQTNTRTRITLVTMNVIRTNAMAQLMVDTQVQLKLTAQTRYAYAYTYRNQTQTRTTTMSALRVGQVISVTGMYAYRTWNCYRLTIGSSLAVLP